MNVESDPTPLGCLASYRARLQTVLWRAQRIPGTPALKIADAAALRRSGISPG